MFILFPGRHHLLTNFQMSYLKNILKNGLFHEPGVDHKPLKSKAKIKAIIFAVTSANHTHTRRNPLPFYLRAIALEDFSNQLDVPTYIYGIDDVGMLPNFSEYVLKKIDHESDGKFKLNGENTIVLCSTPVLNMYQDAGFKILPAELENEDFTSYKTKLPWEIVEHIAQSNKWENNPEILEYIHPASLKIIKQYGYDQKIKMLFNDDIIGEDGDITETRDYNTYVRQMDEIADLKYQDTAPFIKSGRIGDIGCAVGSWIKLACIEPALAESDFYGVEVARQLYNICNQRKDNGDFANPFVFFIQKNAVTGLVFGKNSMNTIHSSSLTHEIESYGNREDLLNFINNRFEELALNGLWINRDVVGPEDKEKIIFMKLNDTDGHNEDFHLEFKNNKQLESHLNSLSTFSKFLRFAHDYRKEEGYQVKYDLVENHGNIYIKIKLADACEFMSKKDYTDNWKSEMHETFTFWSFNEWKKALKEAGFKIHPSSHAYTNEWIVINRFEGKVELFKEKNCKMIPLKYPVSHMLMLAEKI